MLALYTDEQIEEMKSMIEDLCLLAMKKRFAAIENTNTSMYIDPYLFKMPVLLATAATACGYSGCPYGYALRSRRQCCTSLYAVG